MTTLYLDCTFGIAGDMTLAALIDLGADLERIASELHRLPIDTFTLGTTRVDRRGISAQLLEISLDADHAHSHDHDQSHSHHHTPHEHAHDAPRHAHHHAHRRAADILALIAASRLPERVKQRATAVFAAIARAEGRIHGIDPGEVHLHEVGAMDSIIDVIGVCLALEQLDVDGIRASSVPVGHGTMMMAHGRYPIPAPATLELLQGVPLSALDAEGELTTPTGAAFLTALVESFGPMPALVPTRIGYGAGRKDFAHPNVVRAVLFKAGNETPQRETISVLECQLDDITGEQLGHVMERTLASGALDLFYTPVTMKKSRPGTLITVLALPHHADALERLLLVETTTFGVRRTTASRRILDRRIATLETSFGPVRVKIGTLDGQTLRTTPEFEDVRALALSAGPPFAEVLAGAQAAIHHAAGNHVAQDNAVTPGNIRHQTD